MPYIRRRGNQLVLVHGERDSETGKVQQHILFTIYSKAEALKIIGLTDSAGADRFQDLLQHQYPGIRFDWNKINGAIGENLNILPALYHYKRKRLQARFRKDLCAFARQLILTDPQDLLSSGQLIRENRHELEYLADLIQVRLKLKDQEQTKWNSDNQFYWRAALRGNDVPPETEQEAAAYYNRGQYDRAESTFKLLTECFTDYAEGHNYLGLIALEQDNLDKAISCFEKTMDLGRKSFPKKFARTHYWKDLSTRPYIRGMRNMTQALNLAGRYEEALSFCDQLERECADDISAASYRCTIYMNTGKWREAADAAINLNGIIPAESLRAAFAFYELGNLDHLLPHFLYGTLNYPQASKMINGQRTREPKTNTEIEDHNTGVSLCRSLHSFKRNQSRRSKRFFKAIFKHPDIAPLIDETEGVKNKWFGLPKTTDASIFDRMQRLHSFEFAAKKAIEIQKTKDSLQL